MILRINKYTLVELLITIAIFLSIITLISPVLRKVSNRAEIIQCKNNLKSIVLASIFWSEDNNDYTVGASWWKKGNNTSVLPYIGYENQSLANTFTCPSVDTSQLKGRWRNGIVENLSYGVNGYSTVYTNFSPGAKGLPGKSKQAIWGPQRIYWDNNGVTRSFEIRKPSNYLYFMDHGHYMVLDWNFNPLINQNNMNHITRWHPPKVGSYGSSNHALYDGSVREEPLDFSQKWRTYFYK